MTRYLTLIALLAAAPAAAQQNTDGQLPSEAACNAVRERVQLSLAQADRALQAENNDDVTQWSSIAANYAEVYASFCADRDEG